MAEWQPGLFALPPGVDFASRFVEGLRERMSDQPPEAMARVTIFANASRTLAAIRDAFDNGPAILLPQLRVVTDLGAGPASGRGPLMAPLARRLQLARLIQRLLEARPDLAAGHSAPALARSLSELMSEMQNEGLGPTALDAIDPGDHARHWQNALAFLRIAAQFHLAGPAVDRAARQRADAEAFASDWAQGLNLPADPVIVAGSTGSHGATRLFMRAVAGLPNGAVVLPGFDFNQPKSVWDGLDETAEDHPQARFAPLIRACGHPRPWTPAEPPAPARNAVVALALRPAPVTDQWIAEGPHLPDLILASAGLTLIEADQPGHEAEAIALIMREAAEHGRPITLIAADRELIRRVTTALDRWNLRPDDSAGRPLQLTPPGLLLRHVAAILGQPVTIDRLLVLLKHPLTASGSAQIESREARLQARELELYLRRKGPAFPDGPFLRDWGTRGDDARRLWASWLADWLEDAAQAQRAPGARDLAERLSELRDLTEALAAGPGGHVDASRLWREKAGQMALAVMDQLQHHAAEGPAMTAADLSALLLDELGAMALRGDLEVHHLLRIRGPREARVLSHGDLILSGLNEGGWPQATPPDPWLSRQMRLAAGLTLPERRIGLAAHDFQQAIAADRVILTRARRNAEAETIPSRWLNRLLNLMAGLPDRNGPEALAQMRARGATWLAMVNAMGKPGAPLTPAARPSPVPPAPPFTELPVTDVSLLIRDPYAVYAKRVLGLRPLNPLRPEPDAAMRGQVLHLIVERMMRPPPDPATPPDQLRATFLELTAEVLDEQVPWPSARAFWMARITNIADRIVADELARLAEGRPHVIEERGRLRVPGLDLDLTAQPDRIDMLNDGRVAIYDYKSGTPPTDAQIAYFDKQLVLEAAIARHGGFRTLGRVDVAAIRYIQLGGEGKTHDRDLSPGIEADNWDGFLRLMAAYLTQGAGFTALRAPERREDRGEYAHLARFGEWSLTDPGQPQKVGDHG